MGNIKPIETFYNGVCFRSKLEASWALFFDQTKTEWSHEFEGYVVNDKIKYLPDFLLWNVNLCGNHVEKLFVEVKGELTDYDREKMHAFTDVNSFYGDVKDLKSLVLVGDMPHGATVDDICESMLQKKILSSREFYSMEYVNRNLYFISPVVDKNGSLAFLNPNAHRSLIDEEATVRAFNTARRYDFAFQRKR